MFSRFVTYIGQTKQYLKFRIYEHKYSIRTKNSECTMLTNLGHNFDFSNYKILDKERNLEKKINFRKMVEILNTKNSIDKKLDIWNVLLIIKHF